MNDPASIIARMAKIDVYASLTASGQDLRLRGPEEFVKDMSSVLPLVKPQLVAFLQGLPELQPFLENIKERVAILEYDGGFSRKEAEAAALQQYVLKAAPPRDVLARLAEILFYDGWTGPGATSTPAKNVHN